MNAKQQELNIAAADKGLLTREGPDDTIYALIAGRWRQISSLTQLEDISSADR